MSWGRMKLWVIFKRITNHHCVSYNAHVCVCVCVCVVERYKETHIHLTAAPWQVEQHTHSQLSECLQLVSWKLLKCWLIGLSSFSHFTLLQIYTDTHTHTKCTSESWNYICSMFYTQYQINLSVFGLCLSLRVLVCFTLYSLSPSWISLVSRTIRMSGLDVAMARLLVLHTQTHRHMDTQTDINASKYLSFYLHFQKPFIENTIQVFWVSSPLWKRWQENAAWVVCIKELVDCNLSSIYFVTVEQCQACQICF